MTTKLSCEKGLTNNNVNVSRCNYKCNRTMEFYGFQLQFMDRKESTET